MFEGWRPHWILPNDAQNLADMAELLRWRLEEGGHVAQADLDGAVELMLEKSGGQFIYTKYAFEELRDRHHDAGRWSLPELREQLPSGLHGMYK